MPSEKSRKPRKPKRPRQSRRKKRFVQSDVSRNDSRNARRPNKTSSSGENSARQKNRHASKKSEMQPPNPASLRKRRRESRTDSRSKSVQRKLGGKQPHKIRKSNARNRRPYAIVRRLKHKAAYGKHRQSNQYQTVLRHNRRYKPQPTPHQTKPRRPLSNQPMTQTHLNNVIYACLWRWTLFLMYKIIHNRYRMKEKLGQGSFGTVYKAIDLKTKKYVSIKVEHKTIRFP
jgi:hypothetical protein